MASLAWLARFLIEANWSRVKIAVESVWKFVEIVQNRNGTTYFYRTRIKEPVIITRIKSSSNLLIFLLCFFVVSCWLHASGAFFACCRTCNVLILSHIMSACSMSSESTSFTVGICLLSLIFFNCGWTFGESNNNKSFQIWWISKAKRLVSTLRLWYLILSPQIQQSEARCWTWITIRLITCFGLEKKKGKGSY